MNARDEKPRKSDTGYVAVAIGVLVVILFIGFGWYFSGQPGPAQQAPQQAAMQQEQGDEEEDRSAAADDPATREQQAAVQPGDAEATDTQAGDERQQQDAAKAEITPTFDTIRIEPDGDTVVAGQAAPGANVTLYANSEAIADAIADAGGNWAIVLDKPLAAGNSDLWVSAEKGGAAVRSKQQLAVVIDPDGESTPLVVVQDDGGSRVMQGSEQIASAGADGQDERDSTPDTAGGGDTAMASNEEAAKEEAADEMADKTAMPDAGDEEEPAAAATGQLAGTSADGGDRRMAARGEPDTGADQQAAADTAVRIEAADYDDNGNLYISGRAAPGATVRLYYDNELLGDSTAGENGRWSLSAKRPLDSKLHALRADLLEPGSGDVAGRAEVSLIAQIPGEQPQMDGEERQVADAGSNAERASDAQAGAPQSSGRENAAGGGGYSGGPGPDENTGRDEAGRQAAAAQPGTGEQPPQQRLFTVKRGDNLWRIARSYYGRGIRYTTIFEANKEQIRDPDLIYPDQVFLIPRRVEGATAAN